MANLSQSQLGIFYACQNSDGALNNYQIPFLYTLPKELDIKRLKNTLETVLKAHPYLFSTISTASGEPQTAPGAFEEIPVTEADDIEALKPSFRQAMPLEGGKLFRIGIFITPKGNYLLLNFHHIIFDAGSFGILTNDIEAAYEGKEIEKEIKDGAKLAEDEAALRSSDEFEVQKKWYAEQFADAVDLDSAPVPSSTIPEGTAVEGRENDYLLNVSESTVRAICSRFNAGKSTVFTAAWSKLLADFNASDKAAFATIYNGRNIEGCGRSITMMVRTMPVYADLKAEKNIGEWLEELDVQQKEARKKYVYSFSDVHNDLGIKEDILFAYQGHYAAAAGFPIRLGEQTITAEDLRTPIPGTVLNAQLFSVAGQVEGRDYVLRISSRPDLYTEEMEASIAGSYGAILNSMASAQTIGDIESVPEEQLKWLDGLNPESPQTASLDATVAELFRMNAASRPDSICCVYKDRAFTYSEIDAITDDLAARIQESTSGKPHQVVSYISDRNELMVIFPLAVAKAGCSCQPLDASYPKSRLNFMIKDSGASLLLCAEKHRELVDEYDGAVLNAETADDLIATRNQEGLEKHPQPVQAYADDILILLYTSGTTGTPKGVMLTQLNVAAIAKYNVSAQAVKTDSRIASYASYGFDAFLLDLWTALTSGAQLHIIGEDIRYDLVAIRDYFVANGITHALMTTQVGAQLAMNFPEIPCLTMLMVGGEKLVSLDPPSYRLVNAYGPTENSVYITSFTVQKNERNIPIGRGTANVRLYVVNKAGKRVPMGAAGELWAAGSQVSRGYLNRPDKTEEAFTTNPFVAGQEKEWFPTVYRTGDIVRFREDGEIEFVGRKDGQVKIRGFRIELKEVEAIIREFPGIKDVTVQAFDLEQGGKALAAYIVSDNTIDSAALGAFISERKPPYMVPEVMMQIESIPLNVNGKVDKKRLPEPKKEIKDSMAADSAPAAPLNRLEKELMELVAGLSDCAEFPVTTPLSYVGLTSISSLKLSTGLFKKYGVNISSRDLTHGATIQSIENEILSHLLDKEDEHGKEAGKETPGSIEAKLTDAPLSNSQTGVYFECRKNPDSTTYNIPCEIVFPSSVKTEALKAAVEKVIAAHPILLARFDDSTDVTRQILNTEAKPLVAVSDKGADAVRKDFIKPFNLSEGPLYRAVICGCTLFIDVHHLVMDGSSLSIMLHQICDILEGRDIVPESFSFFEYAADDQTRDDSEAAEFFRKELSTVEDASVIPADLHGNEEEGRTAETVLEVDHNKIKTWAKEHGITAASVYLSALEYLTARYCNTTDVCISTISSGRSDQRISDTAGMFVNTLALTAHIDSRSVRGFVCDSAEKFTATISHENYPFAKIADSFGLKPEIMFIYQVGVLDRYTVNGEEVTMTSLESGAPKTKLALLVEERGNGIKLVAQYNNALYSDDMMERFLDSLSTVLDGIVGNPDAKINSLSIISPSQLKEVEGMRCGEKVPMPVRVLHKGIEDRVAAHPDKIAVICTDRSLTYSEFDREANRMANALIAAGFRKGQAVVALLPRDSRLLCCLFGIMKAGGAFIPCDPEYPTERIRLIAEDSGAAFVVTTAGLAGNYGERGMDIDRLSECDNDNPTGIEVSPDDPVYMIYTSGSTGKPKGVRVAHRNITTMLSTCPSKPEWRIATDCERICNIATISFDAFLYEYTHALFFGRTFVFADEVQAKDPIALTGLLQKTGADYFGCTSSRMLQYLELPEFAACLSKCKVILQGGEKFSEALLSKLKDLNENATILNGYGPTEISICCNSADLQHAEKVNVGKPCPNYTEWILDRDGNELPVGVTGELCVGGEGVTLGYNNLPEKTAEKYISYSGMRAFKTGDYARWTAEGNVEILGRTDNQVKLRGLRIELGEVESAISKVEGVKNVLVKICRIQGRDHLSAYYAADRKIDPAEMKKTISETLTAYMVPTAYLQMDALPLTPNGKVDFRHLPDPVLSGADGDYVAPKGKDEIFFADTFAKILELDKVGAQDSFFSLGGTSLVVMKVVIAAQKAGYSITYADVFAHPTPASLAAFAGSHEATEADPDDDVRDFDYSSIKGLLRNNTLECFISNQARRPLGTVLLTGATGFLGIHIFRELVEKYPDSAVHCLLRSKNGISAGERLKQMCFYYFEKDITPLMGSRVFVHEGDVTSRIEIQEKTDTLINCAALVKHFAKGTEIEDVNVGGVKSCIEFCLKHEARLIQVSTYSVGGASANGEPDINAFSETMLYEGQRLHNQYIHSKIMGERLLLDAVATKGLDAKVMRVGNLSARSADGEFQINVQANSFMGRLKIYQMLGALPYSAFTSPVEFSPIDETAAAICTLAMTSSSCTVFHPYNIHSRMLGDVLARMQTIGKEVRLVEDGEFTEILSRAKSDEAMQEKLSAMLAYESKDGGDFIRVIPPDNSFTTQVLLRMGFKWSETAQDYVDQFLRQIDGLEFFDNPE